MPNDYKYSKRPVNIVDDNQIVRYTYAVTLSILYDLEV